MKINLNQAITDLDNKPISDTDGKEFTLRDACVRSLLNLIPNENPTPEEKQKWFTLSLKVHNVNEEVELSADDIVQLKKRIGLLYGALIVGRAYQLLDPAG